MKQSHWASFAESIINIVVGFGISIAAQAIFLPMLGVPIPWTANFMFGAIMTVISIARSYGLRRLFEAMHIRRPLSPFMQAVIAERFRQQEIEGYGIEYDDQLTPGTLSRIAIDYAQAWWDNTDSAARRDLAKAGALIVAEGERFDRARKRKRRDAPPVAPGAPASWRGPGRRTCGPAMTDERIPDRSSIVKPFAHNKTASEQGGASA